MIYEYENKAKNKFDARINLLKNQNRDFNSYAFHISENTSRSLMTQKNTTRKEQNQSFENEHMPNSLTRTWLYSGEKQKYYRFGDSLKNDLSLTKIRLCDEEKENKNHRNQNNTHKTSSNMKRIKLRKEVNVNRNRHSSIWNENMKRSIYSSLSANRDGYSSAYEDEISIKGGINKVWFKFTQFIGWTWL